MMKKTMITAFFLFLLIFAVSCGGSKNDSKSDDSNTNDENVINDDDSVTDGKFKIAGFVQKGPFVQGSEITIAEIDSELVPIGTSYTTSTEDDFGSFDIRREMSTNFVEVTSSGFYFNEVEGKLSAAAISFRVVADLTEGKPVNINILTTIERERIKVLINDGKTFEEARAQAETEILAVFNIKGFETSNFQEMDISKEGDSNAILLAISAVLQQGNTEAELSELISKIAQDIKLDGKLDASNQITKIIENGKALDLAAVRTNLEARYEDLGLALTIPKFEDFVDSDGDGLINRFDFTADFTAVTNADLDKEYTSNEITVVLPPEMTEATATTDNGILVVNSEEKSASEKVAAGDKIAIKLKASKTHGVTEKASLKVEYEPYDVQGEFSVTTKADKYFSLNFTSVENADINKDYTSNEQTVVIPETIADAAATLDNGTLLVNGADKGKSATVVNGDKVAVKLSTADYDTDKKGKLDIDYLGNVVSGEFKINAPRMICNASTCEDIATRLVWQKDHTGEFADGWFDASKYCLDLNLGGKTDWRLPKVWEFRTIVRGCPSKVMENGTCGVTESCLTANCAAIGDCTCEGGSTFFQEASYIWEKFRPMSGGFWTGSDVEGDTSKVWVAFPWDGPKIQPANKTDSYTAARCVRSDDDIDEEYSEIFKDTSTGLEWTKENNDNGNPEAYCAGLVLEGKDDWRLPNITELRTIVKGCANVSTGGSCQAYHDCAMTGTCGADTNSCLCTESIDGNKCFYDMGVFQFVIQAMPSSTIYNYQRYHIEFCGGSGRLRWGPVDSNWSTRCVRP